MRVEWRADAVVARSKRELAGALPAGLVRRNAQGRIISRLYELQSTFTRAVLHVSEVNLPSDGLKGYAKIFGAACCCGAVAFRRRRPSYFDSRRDCRVAD